MKLSGGDSEILGMPVDTLLVNTWNSSDFTSADVRHFLIGEDTKLTLGDTDDENNDQKPTIDDLDLLLTTTTTTTGSHHANNTLVELKPLPPFTGYTGHLSINGISGHHYHAIATAPNTARVIIEENNNLLNSTNQNNNPYFSTDHVVSSSTMENSIENIKSENTVLDYGLSNDVDDEFAAIIGSAIADTTVPGNHGDGDDSGDSWLDLDAWIVSHCGQNVSPTSSKSIAGSHTNNSCSNSSILCTDNLQDFVTNSQFSVASTPSQVMTFPPPLKAQHPPQQSHHSQQRDINTTFSHMPLLQNRLQNGPPKQESQEIAYNIVSECHSPSSSTPYLPHSPPCHVVSTSDVGFIQVHSSTRPSPELQVSFPHTTTPTKKSRIPRKTKIASSIVYSDGNLGKEKTVHRCNICNRGFLNKSNIKVHLRTHTGEKPFRCEVCGKAFRQKAHLIKHAQIHKRVGRD
ncbi:hypothetical protein PGB90_007592 [Kerria lacca]